jgi:hypothetical protein
MQKTKIHSGHPGYTGTAVKDQVVHLATYFINLRKSNKTSILIYYLSTQSCPTSCRMMVERKQAKQQLELHDLIFQRDQGQDHMSQSETEYVTDIRFHGHVAICES